MDEMMLDRLLARAASETPYPVTPDLRARVATAISNDSQGERRPNGVVAQAAGQPLNGDRANKNQPCLKRNEDVVV